MAEGKKKSKSEVSSTPIARKSPNSTRRNGKAWKRRVCGVRHSEVNCPACVGVYNEQHNRRVTKHRAAKVVARQAANEVSKSGAWLAQA